jgi:thiamine biosynthesis lipoprotein
MMDTYVTIYAIGLGRTTIPAIGKAFDRMQEIDEKFNHLNTESPIYAFNRQGTPVTDREIVDVASLALEVSGRSEGAFDITILSLAELWGFYGDGSPHVPADNRIKDCLRNTGYKGLRIEDGALQKTNENIRIDLGGIAKGYAISESVRVLKAEGIKSALIDAGGDVYALGRRGNRLWKVGIRNPHGEDLLGYLEVEDMAIMGSGDYERFFMEKGKKYHHIFDPRTGYPSEGLSGITLVHPDPLLADAWNTALFVMGPEKAVEAVENIPSMETIEVTTAGVVSFSSGLKDALQVISNNK